MTEYAVEVMEAVHKKLAAFAGERGFGLGPNDQTKRAFEILIHEEFAARIKAGEVTEEPRFVVVIEPEPPRVRVDFLDPPTTWR